MKKRLLNNAHLPASNSNEDLETLSRNKLSLLLESKLFEVRHETHRDKGIDMTIELKQDGYYTNFRFAVQLKSTDSIATNKDNSISFPIELTNINYLLNYGMPAYYILYEKKGDRFYLENVNQVYGSVLKKYGEGKLPAKFKVRFSKLITPETIEEIYQQTLYNGTLLRRLNPHLKYSPPESKQISGIVIDEDNEIYSVEQNIAFINQFGFELMNQAQFKRITEIEQRTHPRSSASPIFNFVCGIAYYQQSNLFKALDLLKLAELESSAFNSETQSMLRYTLIHAKYLLGMIDKENFKSQISKIITEDDLGSFLQLERAYKAFLNNNGSDRDRLKIFYETTKQIISKDDHSKSRTFAYAQLLKAEEKILVNDLSRNLVLICGRVKDYTKIKTYQTWVKLESQYTQRLNSVFDFSFKQKDYMSMTNLGLDKLQWTYSKIFIHYTLNNWNKTSLTVEGTLMEEDRETLIKIAAKVDGLIKGYETLGHFENAVLGLMLKYEILHFANQQIDADLIAKEIIIAIEKYELNGLKNNYNNIINGGTQHERFIISFVNHLNIIYEAAKNSGLSEYMSQDIQSDMLSIMENNIEWSIENFYEFNFSE